ncbi:MAG: 30S ribosomal protein S8 [Candidatus Micrarchaeota archaeon]|nr:30S ribosomal protein S8 [Candidatus Micrarchaeota archaeon]
MTNDPLADALNTIRTHEIVGKDMCDIRPASKIIREVLAIFHKHNYVGNFEFADDGRSGSLKVELTGRINDCGVIKPRFAVKHAEWSRWEQRFIPGKTFGFLIVSTPLGLMTNEDAKKEKIGGRLIAYIY